MKQFKIQRMFFYLIAICFTVMSAQGWNAAHAAKLEKNVIKVGFAGGMNFIFGKQMLQGAQDAAEEINKAGGVLGSRIEIVSADTSLTAAGAASAIAKLVISDKVDYLIGAYTSEESTAFLAEATKRKIVTLTHTTTMQFDDAYKMNPTANKYFFALSSSEFHVADHYIDSLPYVVKTLKKELGLKKINVAYISDNALWTVNIDKMMKAAFEKYKDDVNLVYFSKPARNASDFTTEMTEMIKKDVQLVYLHGGYASVIPFVKQFSQMKVPALLGGSITLAMTPEDFIKSAGRENTGYIFIQNIGTQLSSARDAKLYEEFKSKHGVYPGYYALEGYNFIKALAGGLEKAGSMHADALIPAIEKNVVPPEKAWGGAIKIVNHRLVFDYNGNKGMRKYTVQYTPEGDKTVIIYPEKGAMSKIMIPDFMYKKWKE